MGAWVLLTCSGGRCPGDQPGIGGFAPPPGIWGSGESPEAANHHDTVFLLSTILCLQNFGLKIGQLFSQ